jgi:hypothetical protein
VGPRVGLDDVEKRKFLILPGQMCSSDDKILGCLTTLFLLQKLYNIDLEH